MKDESFTFVSAVNDMDVLQKNLCLSPCINSCRSNQFIIKRNYPAASLAYNEAINESENETVIFVHQDIFLPESWLTNLRTSLYYFNKEKIQWGVLGCYGVRNNVGEGIELGQVYTNGLGIVGHKIDKPEYVETLDEIVLVIQKSSDLRFDQSLPSFHLYGTDLCMSAREKGLLCYAIPAFCIHNTNQILHLPKEFYECYRHIKRKWKKYLPIYTSCIEISRFDRDLHLRQLHEVYKKYLCKQSMPIHRAEDPRTLANIF
jgi:Glycosyltransferase like family